MMSLSCQNLLRFVALVTVCLSLPACSTSDSGRTIYADGETVETKILKTQHLLGIGKFREFPVKGSRTPNVEYPRYEIKDGTKRIPALLNHGFSMSIAIYGLPGGPHALPVEIRHPDFIRPDGTHERVWTGHMLVRSSAAMAVGKQGYLFSYPYEVAPGPWEIRVKYRERVICKERFDVYAPPSKPAGL